MVHLEEYRRVLDEVVADKAEQRYWDHVFIDENVEDRWIQLRLGSHPVDMRGRRFTVEYGGALSIAQQIDGCVIVAIVPCHLEGDQVEPIVIGAYKDPSLLTGTKLKGAVKAYFRAVRVTSVALTATQWDQLRVAIWKFGSEHPGLAKVMWVLKSWPAVLLGIILSIWGIHLGYQGIAAAKPVQEEMEQSGRGHKSAGILKSGRMTR